MQPLLSVVLTLLTSVSFCLPLDDGQKVQNFGPIDPDQFLDPMQLIESRGYVAESHEVTTLDGYILTLFRIVNPLITSGERKPVLLQHGLLSSSIDFLINSPGGYAKSLNFSDLDSKNFTVENNLGFVLSQFGYDVWLGNSRGNTYSKKHTTLDPKCKDFWNFTFDEMAEYDLPAVIDYILKKTNKKTLSYIGHSQGTAIMFALLSSHPEYANLVKPFIALAPVTKVTHIEAGPLKFLAHRYWLRDYVYHMGGELLGWTPTSATVLGLTCESPLKFICSDIIFEICGQDVAQLNYTRLPVYVSHTPAGTSWWNLLHWAQVLINDEFAMFDYGFFENIKKYKYFVPPVYSLDNILSTDIALFYSHGDKLADPRDVNWLKSRLEGKMIFDYQVPDPDWNHLDFIWAEQTGKYVNLPILKVLHSYS